MASGQQARRADLKKESERRAGIEDTARSQVNNFLGGSNGLGAVNDQNRNLYLGVLGQTMRPGFAESSINSGIGGYFGAPQPGAPQAPQQPSLQMPQPSQRRERPQFYKYADDARVYRGSDDSHIASPEEFFAQGGARDWSNVTVVPRGHFDAPTPTPAAPVAEAEPPVKQRPQTGGDLTTPTLAEARPRQLGDYFSGGLAGTRAGLLRDYFDPSSPTAGQTPGAYLPTGQVARRRQMREASNRGATTFSRNYMNANLRGLADEEADRESAQDEAQSFSGARAGYDQLMRGTLADYDREQRGELANYDAQQRAERQSQADRELQRLLSTLGITSGMSQGSQNLYGGLLSNNLNAATGAAQDAFGQYDQARAQQGQGWMQALNAAIGAGTGLLGGYMARPASMAMRAPRPVPPASILSGRPF